VALPDRWQEWRQLLSSQSDEEMRERLTQHHEDLRAFYGRSAVVKHFSF
jgi:hypothetical protein